MKNFKSLFILPFVFLFLFLSIFQTIKAENNDDTNKSDLEKKAEELKKEAEEMKRLIELKQKEQGVISSQIDNIIKENERVENDIKNNKQKIDSIQADIQRIDKNINQKEAYIKLKQQILKKIIRDYYQDYSKTSDFFKMVENNESLFENNDRLSLTMGEISEIISSIKKEQVELGGEKENLQKKIGDINDAKYELEKRNQYLDNTKAQKENLIAQALNEKQNYQKKLTKLEEEQLAIQNEIDKLDYDSTGTYSVSDLPPKSKAGFSRPVFNPYIMTQGYGKTNFSYNYKGGLHNGIDFVAKSDKSIISAGDGKVVATGAMGRYGYGNWVAVDHKNGLITLYGHMSSIAVKKGDELKRGDKVGIMGSTGFSTGPHLHFSIFVAKTFSVVKSSSIGSIYIPTGASVNPNNYL